MKWSRSSPFAKVIKDLNNNFLKPSACRLHVYTHTTKPTNMIGSMCQLRECRLIRSGLSGLPYYRTPLVYIPDVIGGQAVWRHHNNKAKDLLLRWDWGFLERTRILSGIQFTTHFIEFFVVETKQFVGRTVHVILTRQTCGQRSSRAAESKHRALENNFPERMCYVFRIHKYRRD